MLAKLRWKAKTLVDNVVAFLRRVRHYAGRNSLANFKWRFPIWPPLKLRARNT
jgi:hypothetical protein